MQARWGRFALGIALASVATYLWGFLFWGATSLPYGVWEQSPDDATTQAALLEHFPENGTYFVPGFGHEAGELAELYESGPVAMVHVSAREGRPQLDPGIMARGFGVIVGSALLLGLLLRWTALPDYGRRVRLACLVGLLAAWTVDLGDTAWWGTPLDWKLVQALYTATSLALMGAVLARFTPVAEVS